MKPYDSNVKVGLSGLNPQLQSWPASLEIVSELVLAALLALPEPLLELDCEPAVQPAATMAPYLVRRLMPSVLTADGPAVLWVLTGRGAGGCARSRRLPHAPGP